MGEITKLTSLCADSYLDLLDDGTAANTFSPGMKQAQLLGTPNMGNTKVSPI